MRTGNVLIVGLGSAALIAAIWIAWRGRRLPVLADRELPTTFGASALDGLRTIAAVVGAAVVAGVLVPGMGGRLFMRLMAATSGDSAQGKLTEAEEIVGDVTFGGSIGFVIFVGIFLPVAAALFYLALRHFLPAPVYVGGLMFGILLLATLGVGDPMSPDNIDFEVLTPLWLAIAGITALALLYGLTFGALATRFDTGLRPLSAGRRTVPGHAGLLIMVVPPVAVLTVVYVVIRTIARGRTKPTLERPGVRYTGMGLVVVGTVVATFVSLDAAIDIL